MRNNRFGSWRTAVIALVAVVLAAGCKSSPEEKGKRPEPTGPNAAVLRLMPAGSDVTDWKASGDAKVYGPATDAAAGVEAIESDLGPQAAMVRGYEFVKSATRTYVRGAAAANETMTVRVFEMSNAAEAYGLYSVRAAGTQFPAVGLEARMSDKALGFVKGPFFVSLQYSGANTPTNVLMEFGNAIAGQIVQAGYRPALLERMPGGSLQGQRYFVHTFDTLLAVPCMPKTDATTVARMLDLTDPKNPAPATTEKTSVAIAGYPTDKLGETNCIFVIQYPSDAAAQAAYKAYDGYLQNSTNPADKNIAVAPPVRAYMAGTFNAEENSVPGPDMTRKYDMLSALLKSLGS
jgi:hypothetical protein